MTPPVGLDPNKKVTKPVVPPTNGDTGVKEKTGDEIKKPEGTPQLKTGAEKDEVSKTGRTGDKPFGERKANPKAEGGDKPGDATEGKGIDGTGDKGEKLNTNDPEGINKAGKSTFKNPVEAVKQYIASINKKNEATAKAKEGNNGGDKAGAGDAAPKKETKPPEKTDGGLGPEPKKEEPTGDAAPKPEAKDGSGGLGDGQEGKFIAQREDTWADKPEDKQEMDKLLKENKPTNEDHKRRIEGGGDAKPQPKPNEGTGDATPKPQAKDGAGDAGTTGDAEKTGDAGKKDDKKAMEQLKQRMNSPEGKKALQEAGLEVPKADPNDKQAAQKLEDFIQKNRKAIEEALNKANVPQPKDDKQRAALPPAEDRAAA